MFSYEFVYIATNPIIIFAIYKLFNTYLGEEVYNKKMEKLSYFIYFILLSGVIFVTRLPIIMLIFNLLSLFLISLNYIAPIQKKIVSPSLIYAILCLIEIIVYVASGFLSVSMYKDSLFNSLVGIILIRTVTMIVAYLINKYKKSIKKDFTIPPIYYIAFTIILFGTLYLFLVSLANSEITMYNLIISGFILILVNVTMIVIDEKIYTSILVENEKNILKQQNIAYEKQAEIINQSTESIRALKHDMKNHLITMSNIYVKGKKEELEPYIEKILEEMGKEIFSQSNNFVIDSIINFKLRQMEDMGVDIKLDVNAPHNINISAYDMTVILGNLLDNAITAMEKVERKIFDLSISCSKGNMIILMENSFNGILVIENGKLKTTKSEANHGIGLENIEKSLKRYGGEIRTAPIGNKFSVDVIIPYEN